MNIDLIFKIAGIGIIVAVLNLVLKRAERVNSGSSIVNNRRSTPTAVPMVSITACSLA